MGAERSYQYKQLLGAYTTPVMLDNMSNKRGCRITGRDFEVSYNVESWITEVLLYFHDLLATIKKVSTYLNQYLCCKFQNFHFRFLRLRKLLHRMNSASALYPKLKHIHVGSPNYGQNSGILSGVETPPSSITAFSR